MTASVERLRSLAACIRHNATANRAVERIGPFVATFTDRGDNPFLNHAIPDDGASPSRREVAALVAACRRRGRTPRLEYFPRWRRRWRRGCGPPASRWRGAWR
ncbi:MAG TPA: hypothetical protein VGC06_05850 [Actinomycetes bacterium]